MLAKIITHSEIYVVGAQTQDLLARIPNWKALLF
jgi:hypothetical protein